MVIKIPILILAFVYIANFLLSLLQLQVVILIQAFVYGFSSFWIVLDHCRSFQFVLTLVSTVRSYYSCKLCLSHELRDSNLSYLSKDKKAIKTFVLQFTLKFLINKSCFDKEARGWAFHFVENFSKNDLTIKLGFILIQKRLKYEISNPVIKKMLKIDNKITITKLTIKAVVR